MIYLLRKYDIISVPSYAAGIYHRAKSDIISKIYHPFCRELISLKNDKFLSKLVVFLGGGDGNRTRVQKPVDMTFSVGSLSFKISRAGTSANRLSFAVALLCLIGSRAKDRCKFTAVNDAQAEGAVFLGGTGGIK